MINLVTVHFEPKSVNHPDLINLAGSGPIRPDRWQSGRIRTDWKWRRNAIPKSNTPMSLFLFIFLIRASRYVKGYFLIKTYIWHDLKYNLPMLTTNKSYSISTKLYLRIIIINSSISYSNIAYYSTINRNDTIQTEPPTLCLCVHCACR